MATARALGRRSRAQPTASCARSGSPSFSAKRASSDSTWRVSPRSAGGATVGDLRQIKAAVGARGAGLRPSVAVEVEVPVRGAAAGVPDWPLGGPGGAVHGDSSTKSPSGVGMCNMNRGPDSWTAFRAEARRARGRWAGGLQSGGFVDNALDPWLSKSIGVTLRRSRKPCQGHRLGRVWCIG